MCFKCGLCGKLLDSTNCTEHEGELFCKVCHGRKFGPKGYGFGGGAGCLSMDQGEHLKSSEELARGSNAILEPRAIAKAPEGEGCPRCGGYVYAAEQMLARGRQWHKECFKCANCSKRLDSVNCCEGPDKDIYCKVCYGKKFGPKGYGYGQGGGALQSDCYANGWVFRAESLRREHARYNPASRLLHSHYIRCACLLNSLLSEEIRSARYWPRWGYVDRAAVRY